MFKSVDDDGEDDNPELLVAILGSSTAASPGDTPDAPKSVDGGGEDDKPGGEDPMPDG